MKMIVLHLFYCCMAIYTIDYNGFYLFFACSQIVLLTEGVFKLIGVRRISMKLLTISTKNLVNLLGVANIREYEENQLKAAQDMAEERLSLSSQLSKLKYQYAFFPLSIRLTY